MNVDPLRAVDAQPSLGGPQPSVRHNAPGTSQDRQPTDAGDKDELDLSQEAASVPRHAAPQQDDQPRPAAHPELDDLDCTA